MPKHKTTSYYISLILKLFMDDIYYNTGYTVGRLTANENHALWFLIFVKSTGGSVAVYVVDS